MDGVEDFFQGEKKRVFGPGRFDDTVWREIRDDVMMAGLRQKFKLTRKCNQGGSTPSTEPTGSQQRPEVAASEKPHKLAELLLSTYPHRLVSIKGDAYWGFDPFNGIDQSENRLALLLEQRREELLFEVRN